MAGSVTLAGRRPLHPADRARRSVRHRLRRARILSTPRSLNDEVKPPV
jgi:hypothetical protein